MRAWTDDERRIALGLYYRTPFGQIHSRNPIIIRVAEEIGRTPSSLAMKMLNFSSLDPLITSSGRSGLGNASQGDKHIWEQFSKEGEEVVEEVERRLEVLGVVEPSDELPNRETESMGPAKQRRGQRFFRASILASYDSTCCISGIRDPRLLIASHIVPWHQHRRARLDPRNGLCLSSLHDCLFDNGIITVTSSYTILVSSNYTSSHKDDFSADVIHTLHGRSISSPQKFAPLASYLEYHNERIFEGHA